MKHALALSLLAASLAGCATAELQQDTTYRVEWIGERPLIDRSHLTVVLGKDGRAYGNAGCNHWFAGYTLQDERITFNQAASTRKMCAESLMEQEQRFLAMLGTIQRWDFSPTGQLRLWPAEGKPLALWPEEG
ncbi:META domain protein [compost metagenome]